MSEKYVRTPTELTVEVDLDQMVKEVDKKIKDEKITMKKWTRAFINTLPNGSFAAIEPAYLKGETDDKRARHLPFKNADGSIDLPHLRNALARANQIKPITDSISAADLRKKAARKLAAAKKKVGMA